MDIFKHHHVDNHGTIESDPSHAVSVPEIDPAGAVGAITFLVFAIACWLGRSGKK